jgi:hypothetical protein
MRKDGSYPIELKRQAGQGYLAGETLHGLVKRHQVSRNLVRIWMAKYEAARSTTTSLPPISCRFSKRASPRWSVSSMTDVVSPLGVARVFFRNSLSSASLPPGL